MSQGMNPITKTTRNPLREKMWCWGVDVSQWINRQRLIRTAQTKAIGILADNEVTTSLQAKKKKINSIRSPSSAPITNPLREKIWGRKGDGSQVRYGQRLARTAHVTPIVNAVRTSSA